MSRSAGLMAVLLVLAGCTAPQPETESPTSSPPATPTDVTFESLRLETEMGPIVIVLYPEAAPQTLDLLRAYVEERYYEGREFNRVVPGHVIQVIDKVGGATDDPRTVPLEAHPEYHFSAGAAGIARGADPNSGGPEFFIMDFATSHLDGNYTVWGQVVEGLEIVHRIARVPAVESPRLPQDPVGLMDRTAIDGIAITDAKLTQVQLPAETTSVLPMRVAKNVRNGEFRHSMEWPRSLSPGGESLLTWYVRPYNQTAPPTPETVRIDIAGQSLPVIEHVDAKGAFDFRWTPPSPGVYNATLKVGADAWTTLQVHV